MVVPGLIFISVEQHDGYFRVYRYFTTKVNDEAGTQNVTDSETVSSQPNIKEAEENVNKPSRPRGWTDDEVKTLREAVKQIGEGKWTKIVALYGAKLGHRSAPGRICSSS